MMCGGAVPSAECRAGRSCSGRGGGSGGDGGGAERGAGGHAARRAAEKTTPLLAVTCAGYILKRPSHALELAAASASSASRAGRPGPPRR